MFIETKSLKVVSGTQDARHMLSWMPRLVSFSKYVGWLCRHINEEFTVKSQDAAEELLKELIRFLSVVGDNQYQEFKEKLFDDNENDLEIDRKGLKCGRERRSWTDIINVLRT